jgi:hypothetical protein
MLTRKYWFLTMGETFFEESEKRLPVDLVRSNQRGAPLPGSFVQLFYTPVIDLRQSPAELFRNFKKDTRSEVRRAEREGAEYEAIWRPGVEHVEEFCNFFDDFAKWRKLPGVNRRRLMTIASSNRLFLSRVTLTSVPIVWHAYFVMESRSRLLHSATVPDCSLATCTRPQIGRSNRLHHWRDMLEFRDSGVPMYDLGGWYEGVTDSKRLSINRFKEEFGGTIVTEYNCVRGLSPLGRLAARVFAIAQSYKKIDADSRAGERDPSRTVAP